MSGSDFLTNALGRAIAKAALTKHLESCEVCTDVHRCTVAHLHIDAATRRLFARSRPVTAPQEVLDARAAEWDGPAWRCLNCDQGHEVGSPEDGCDRCGWVAEEVQP